ncbi:MAG: flagellar type III secretion system pore protein FliP [Oscillospiraceae bacterium]|nr:flagellar type III secretion system pore protein FliP [Oscillospiraceae bacterium]
MIEKKSKKNIKSKKKIIVFFIFIVVLCAFMFTGVSASVTLNLGDALSSSGASDSVNIILFLTVIALAPSILVLMTGFTRILIVLSFVRNALGLQQTPPNQVLIGLSLFLTVFLMSPIFVKINDNALQPYVKGDITQDQAITETMKPLREFMMAQMSPTDLKTFLSITNEPLPANYDDIKTEVLIPAFVINEIKRAFIIGFFIYIPFLIIDLVVASTLMSLGMMMLPPAMVSMPFKLILFMIVDGWGLIITTLMASFHSTG